MRAASAARRVLSGVRTAGGTGSGAAPSEAGGRAGCFFSRRERQAHWSWMYCAATLPHPGEDGDSSRRLKQKASHCCPPSVRLGAFQGETKSVLDGLFTGTPGDSRTSTSNIRQEASAPCDSLETKCGKFRVSVRR